MAVVQAIGSAWRLVIDTARDARTEFAMLATDDAPPLPFSLPCIGRKKITAAFDGGRISSDGGVLLLAGADKRVRLIDTLAALIPDHRDPAQITHTMADIRTLIRLSYAMVDSWSGNHRRAPHVITLDIDVHRAHAEAERAGEHPQVSVPAGSVTAPRF